MLFGLAGLFTSVLWMTLSLPLFLSDKIVLPRTDATLYLGLALIGVFFGVTGPLYFELTAELVYPVPEGVSLGVLVLVQNVAGLSVVILSSFLDYAAPALNFALAVVVGGVFLTVLLFLKEEYRRPKDSDGLRI